MMSSKHAMLEGLPVCEGPLTLRRWTRADTDARASWPSYPSEYKAFNFSLAGASPEDLDRHFLARDQDPQLISLAADHAGQEVIAVLYLHMDWENQTVSNVGFRIRSEWCNRGHGPRILGLAAVWCRECGIQSIRLDVSPTNVRAVRCYEKAGMVRVGDFWRDDTTLVDIDIAREEYAALRPHFRIEGGVPQVRFWWMELKTT